MVNMVDKIDWEYNVVKSTLANKLINKPVTI